MADIFISYAREDRAGVEKLAAALEGAGFTAWWDRHIESGAEFSKDIERELNEAKAVIVAWSSSASESRWVKDEANVAAEAGKLLAVTLDETPPPLGFRQYHALDFSNWAGADDDAVFADLKRALENRMKDEGASAPQSRQSLAPSVTPPSATTISSNSTAEKPSPKVDLRLIVAGAVGLAALILAGVFLTRGSNDAPSQTASVEQGRADIAVATSEVSEKSIAVLPFADMSAAGDQEYFSDGMAEEILNALVRVPDLQVAGRTSSFAFKDRNVDMREIGATLNVAHILEGSVRKQGQRVRITAQLIRADDGFHLWSDTYDGTLEDIFDLQENISQAITRELEIILSPEQSGRLAQKYTDSEEAYNLFLQGRELLYRAWGKTTLPKAVELLKRAIEIDPDFIAAMEALGWAYYLYPQYVPVPDEEVYLTLAQETVERVLEINPNSGEALGRLGSVLIARKQYLEGYRYILQALALDIDSAADHSFVEAYNTSLFGWSRAAIPHYEGALENDPTQVLLLNNAAVTHFAAGNVEQAEAYAQRAVDLGFPGSVGVVAAIMAHRGDSEGAIKTLNAAYEDFAGFSPLIGNLEEFEAAVYAVYSGDSAARAEFTNTLTGILAAENPRVDTVLFDSLANMGVADLWMETFEKYTYSNSGYTLSRIWDDREGSKLIRQHPEFPFFAERIGLVAVWQEYGWPDKCRPLPRTDGSNGQFRCDLWLIYSYHMRAKIAPL